MKKIFNYCLLATVALVAVACEDEITREESPAFNADAMQVYFPVTNESTYEFDPSVKEFTVAIARDKSEKPAEVKLSLSEANGLFEVPASVKFDAGDADTTFTVKVKDEVVPFLNYRLVLSVDDNSLVNPYIANANGTPEFVVNVVFTDYQVVATGTFTSGLFEDSWDQVLMYSKIKNAYVFPDCYDLGYPFEIKIGADGSIDGGTSSKYGNAFNVANIGGNVLTMFFLMGEDYIDATFYDPETKSIAMYCYIYGYNGDPQYYAQTYEVFEITEGEIVLPEAGE